jgi:hypothetical protein
MQQRIVLQQLQWTPIAGWPCLANRSAIVFGWGVTSLACGGAHACVALQLQSELQCFTKMMS